MDSSFFYFQTSCTSEEGFAKSHLNEEMNIWEALEDVYREWAKFALEGMGFKSLHSIFIQYISLT